jgi:hypothetical protein
MKNQFFGDTRDLFKFDLIEHVMKGLDELKCFAYIPMLTPDGEPKSIKPGTKNKDLVAFFNEGRKRDIHDIQKHFKQRGITAKIHGEKGVYFKNDKESRRKYFDQINDDWLVNSLVFLDPDTGIEPKNPQKKHVLFSEIEQIYKRMSKNSAMMIFQFKPQGENIEETRETKSREIKDKVTGERPMCAYSYPVAFFFLAKSKATRNNLWNCLNAYKSTYPCVSIST